MSWLLWSSSKKTTRLISFQPKKVMTYLNWCLPKKLLTFKWFCYLLLLMWHLLWHFVTLCQNMNPFLTQSVTQVSHYHTSVTVCVTVSVTKVSQSVTKYHKVSQLSQPCDTYCHNCHNLVTLVTPTVTTLWHCHNLVTLLSQPCDTVTTLWHPCHNLVTLSQPCDTPVTTLWHCHNLVTLLSQPCDTCDTYCHNLVTLSQPCDT